MIKTVGVDRRGHDGQRDRPGVRAVGVHRAARGRRAADARPRARRRSRRASASSSRRASWPRPTRDAALGRLTTPTAARSRSPTPTTSSRRSSRTPTPSASCSASLDAITRPDVILSSNTSSISITVLGAATKRPDKVLGMHFMNPVPLMTLVELIRGQATSAESMQVATESVREAREDGRRSGRLPRLHRQPHPDADDERGDLRA